jgi:hypothetical protein
MRVRAAFLGRRVAPDRQEEVALAGLPHQLVRQTDGPTLAVTARVMRWRIHHVA